MTERSDTKLTDPRPGTASASYAQARKGGAVLCSACGAESPAGKRFCADCGAPLATVCPACGSAVEAGKRFCGDCGTALSDVDHGATPAQAPPAPVAQRRVCSVLFCDLVGFTPLSEAKDAEAVRELLGRYFETARTVIGRYGGVVEKFIGDAVMAVWGTPVASDVDAERAVRAALELIDEVAALGAEVAAAGLAARAGVVTGDVAVNLGAQGQGMVAGDAVNTAARVQSVAEPGSVLVDERTWRVARESLAFEPTGTHTLKGKAEPLPLWRATRVLSGVGGTQRIDGLEAPFVGRDADLRLVKELFHACAERRSPRLVSVVGAAGVGKSRLGWEFRKYIDGLAETVWWHRGRCLSYGDGVAFWALAEMVRQRLGIAEEDPPATAADSLRVELPQWLDDPAEVEYVLPRLGQLLGTDSSDHGPRLGREELFAGWRLFFERLAVTAPVVLLVEDVQHADPGMLDFLEHLLDWSRDVPLFVLALSRPEPESARGDWTAGRRNSTALGLEPLDAQAMAALLEGLVPGMPAVAKSAIAGRAEGIPLYAVETVRMLIDQDVVQPIEGTYRLLGEVGDLAVPDTLHSLLAARLDALEDDAKALVAAAAVLGGSFPREALSRVSGLPQDEVDRLLGQLVRREVLAVQADPLSPERGQYAFVQAMFRQVAYDTLSRRDRKARHLSVADHLETVFAKGGEEVAEVIAAHLLDALAAVPDDPDVPDLRVRAVDLLVLAASRAQRTGAPASARRAYASAAELLERSGTPEDELAAAQRWEDAGRAARLVSPNEAESDFGRAAEIYRRHGQTLAAARADTGVGAALMNQGRFESAGAVLRQACTALDGEPGADQVAALRILATVETSLGNPAGVQLSEQALVKAQALGLPDADLAELLTTHGTALFIERAVEASAYMREAVRRAEAGQNSAAIARAWANLSDVLLTTDPVGAAEAARAGALHSRRVGGRWMLAVNSCNLMQALMHVGRWDEAESVYAEWAADRSEVTSWDLAPGFVAVLLRSLRGNIDGARQLLSGLDSIGDSDDPQDTAARGIARAAVAMSLGEPGEALNLVRGALDHSEALGLRSDSVRWSWQIAADAALAVGDHAEAQRLVDWLHGFPPGRTPAVLKAERQRITARLLAAHGDPGATEAFAAGTAAMRELGSAHHVAVAILDQADHLARVGDHEQAAALAGEAAQIASGLAATPLATRAARLLGAELPAQLHREQQPVR